MGLIRKVASIMMLGGVSSHTRREPPGKAERARAKAERAREKAAQAPAATPPPPRSPAARQENHRGNQEWRCQAADAADVPTGRARIWLSAAVRMARGSLAAAGYRQAMNRSGRTTIAPSLAICR
jgi:hypothetical protein